MFRKRNTFLGALFLLAAVGIFLFCLTGGRSFHLSVPLTSDGYDDTSFLSEIKIMKDESNWLKTDNLGAPYGTDRSTLLSHYLKTDIDLLAGAEFIGILFTTYIIMQSESDVFFVDQHAAHERVMYEKFIAKKAPGKRVEDRETLLVPQIISVSAADYGFISDNLDRFDENGFEIELLGDREIALRSMPLGSGNKPSVMFEQIMTDLKRDVPAGSDIWYSLIQTTACKAAIKAGDVISREEAISLVMQMTGLEDPYHCAHGRPTFFKISRKDFEKNFRRIV